MRGAKKVPETLFDPSRGCSAFIEPGGTDMSCKYYSAALLLIGLLFSQFADAKYSTNCKGPLPINEESLYGGWKESNERHRSFVTLNKDGSFKGRIETNNKVVWEFAGTWTLKAGVLRWFYTASSLKGIPAGTTDEDKILEITCTSMSYQNIGGRTGISYRADI